MRIRGALPMQRLRAAGYEPAERSSGSITALFSEHGHLLTCRDFSHATFKGYMLSEKVHNRTGAKTLEILELFRAFSAIKYTLEPAYR